MSDYWFPDNNRRQAGLVEHTRHWCPCFGMRLNLPVHTAAVLQELVTSYNNMLWIAVCIARICTVVLTIIASSFCSVAAAVAAAGASAVAPPGYRFVLSSAPGVECADGTYSNGYSSIASGNCTACGLGPWHSGQTVDLVKYNPATGLSSTVKVRGNSTSCCE